MGFEPVANGSTVAYADLLRKIDQPAARIKQFASLQRAIGNRAASEVARVYTKSRASQPRKANTELGAKSTGASNRTKSSVSNSPNQGIAPKEKLIGVTAKRERSEAEKHLGNPDYGYATYFATTFEVYARKYRTDAKKDLVKIKDRYYKFGGKIDTKAGAFGIALIPQKIDEDYDYTKPKADRYIDDKSLSPILTYRGTEPTADAPEGTLKADMEANLDPIGIAYSRFKDSKKDVFDLLNILKNRIGNSVIVTGQSMGGALAQYTAMVFPDQVQEVFTFNAPAVTAIQPDENTKQSGFGSDKKHTTVVVKGDIVSRVGKDRISNVHTSKIYEVTTTDYARLKLPLLTVYDLLVIAIGRGGKVSIDFEKVFKQHFTELTQIFWDLHTKPVMNPNRKDNTMTNGEEDDNTITTGGAAATVINVEDRTLGLQPFAPLSDVEAARKTLAQFLTLIDLSQPIDEEKLAKATADILNKIKNDPIEIIVIHNAIKQMADTFAK